MCLDGILGGSDFDHPNSPGGSAREGPHACGGEESGEALGGSARVETAQGWLREPPVRLWEVVLEASRGARRPCVCVASFGHLGGI